MKVVDIGVLPWSMQHGIDQGQMGQYRQAWKLIYKCVTAALNCFHRPMAARSTLPPQRTMPTCLPCNLGCVLKGILSAAANPTAPLGSTTSCKQSPLMQNRVLSPQATCPTHHEAYHLHTMRRSFLKLCHIP